MLHGAGRRAPTSSSRLTTPTAALRRSARRYCHRQMHTRPLGWTTRRGGRHPRSRLQASSGTRHCVASLAKFMTAGAVVHMSTGFEGMHDIQSARMTYSRTTYRRRECDARPNGSHHATAKYPILVCVRACYGMASRAVMPSAEGLARLSRSRFARSPRGEWRVPR